MLVYVMQAGLIEGRAAIDHINEAQQSKNFTFQWHRDDSDIFVVNSIDFHLVSFRSMRC